MAVHRGTGHDVVLQFLRADAPEDVLRFAREAKLLSAFNHPALPRFYDYAPEASPPYIVMARAPGQPASRLCSPPRLKPAEVAAVGVKLAQVLAVLHARGVLHRDINASNVMIDAHGAVTLLDFGCAELEEKFYDVPAGERRYLTPPEGRVSIPDGGIGRLGWSAPEVRHGTAWSDRSDVYSTGHLLFRLLTGKVPRKGADPPTSPREFVITCPAEIASAIESTLRVDPQARPTAAQLAQRLLDALENEQTSGPRVQADPPSLPVPDPDPATPPAQPAPVIVTAAKVPAVKLPRRTLAWAACFCVAVLVAWWAQRPEHPVVAANSPTPPSLGRPPVSAASVSLGAASPAADMPADSATQRLADAGPALTECARKAGRKVWVDLEVSKGESHFTRINIVGDNSEGCARAVLQQLRFDPPNGAESLVKEYKP
jgi:serine/threonine protein kinase